MFVLTEFHPTRLLKNILKYFKGSDFIELNEIIINKVIKESAEFERHVFNKNKNCIFSILKRNTLVAH